MSLLPQVTLAHILSIQAEEGKKLPRFYKAHMLARTKAENPFYVVLVSGVAEIAKKDFRANEHFAPKDMEELVTQIGMYFYHALDLAARDGEESAIMKAFKTELMSDPDTHSLEFESLSALTETRMLFNRITHDASYKKKE